jgi:mannose-6-phosphate isomerase
MLYPLTFRPIFKERVWGGRRLENLYHKELPANSRIGESWEISDRHGDTSVITNGPLAGRDLRWLMEHHGEELLGRPVSAGERFPWLIKILDCAEDLSLQVHPPASVAARLGGEPKTEIWYVAEATPEARIYVGLRRGVTRAEFEAKARDGTVADCFHFHSVHRGDAMFLPSGRVHAIGGGNVIFEIQQNSDTTYRVFDWNRVGLDGRPRALHLTESMISIDFADFEPPLVTNDWVPSHGALERLLVRDPLFEIKQWRAGISRFDLPSPNRGPEVVGLVEGALEIKGAGNAVSLSAGGFCLVPHGVRYEMKAVKPVEVLQVCFPGNASP